MFATLLGGLPRPPVPDGAATEELVEAAVRAQESAGLDPISDGGQFGEWQPLDAWRATAALTDRSVKQAVQGPYSAGLDAGATSCPGARRRPSTRSSASWPRPAVRSSRSTSRPRRGSVPTLRHGSSSARRIGACSTASTGTHLSLAITGGNADTAGIDTLLAAPYASLAVDLIAGPDNWRLVVATPGDRGIICGALLGRRRDRRWTRAAPVGGWLRGLDRRSGTCPRRAWRRPPRWRICPGRLRSASSNGSARPRAWPSSRLDERVQHLDPRSVSSRTAALGRVDPPTVARLGPGSRPDLIHRRQRWDHRTTSPPRTKPRVVEAGGLQTHEIDVGSFTVRVAGGSRP